MNPEQDVLYRGVSRIAWSYLFAFFNLNLGSLNILPDWMAFALIYGALDLLAEEERELPLLKPFCILLGLWEGAGWLAQLFGLPMRYFCDVYPSGQSCAALLEQEVEQPLLLTQEEYRLIWSLRRFTGRERRILLTMVKTFDALHRPGDPAKLVLPCYLPTRAEGGQTAVDSIAIRHISVKDSETAQAADFAVVLYGSAMEPAYHAGEVLALSRRPAGQDEIGLFNLNGEGYIRLYQRVRGKVRLAALNRAFPNVAVEEGSQFCCLGTVVGRLDLL